jgi:hypothetical protein
LYSLGATLIDLLTRTHPADLPSRNGCIRFEAERLASKPFQTWLKLLIQPDLSQRFKNARSALDALQKEQLTLQSLAKVHVKPRGSRVALTKTDDQLQIVIPPLPLKQKLQVIFSGLKQTSFWCLLLLLGFWKLETLLLVAPLTLWIVSSIWIKIIGKIFEEIRLSIDQREIYLTSNWLGIKKRYSSPTQDIIKLERVTYKEFFDTMQKTSKPKLLYSGLNIWVGNQCYALEKGSFIGGIRQLTPVELDWLAVELSDWLDLPIQTAGEVPILGNQSGISTDVMNTESNFRDNTSDIDSASENDLSNLWFFF